MSASAIVVLPPHEIGAALIVVPAQSRSWHVNTTERNRLGNVKGADPALASAAYGKRLGEEALRAHILAAEPGSTERDVATAPFHVNWDFYGVIL